MSADDPRGRPPGPSLPPWAALPGDEGDAARGGRAPAAPPPRADRGAASLLDGAAPDPRVDKAMRWRLVLGSFADDHLGAAAVAAAGARAPEPDPAAAPDGAASLAQRLAEAEPLEQALAYLYDREFAQRAHRQAGAAPGAGVAVPTWLGQVRRLFPREASQVIERDALVRYGLTELVTDPRILRDTEPTLDIARAILQFKHLMPPDVLAAAREVVRRVVDQLAETLGAQCRPALAGGYDPYAPPPRRSARNVDWPRTIRRNLARWDGERRRLGVDRVSFRHRQRSHGRWRVIIAVDQSGSMLDSLIHSAVMAAIFAALPSVSAHLLLWDTRVVDVSEHVRDPLEVLMGSQLGGGTELLPALERCAALVTEPDRTILVVVSDWVLFRDHEACLRLAGELHEAGVRCLGLCALDTDARPVYDEAFARQLAGRGWRVAALTPSKLAEQVGRLMGGA